MRYAATMPDGRVASWHCSCDSDSVCLSVRDEDTAFHAGGGGVNDRSWGCEFSTTARQTPEQWADANSSAMLELGAELFAIKARQHRIPVRRVTPTEMRALEPGIVGHVDAAKAFRKTTHGDPGVNFPWSPFIARVRYFYDALAPWFS